MANQIKLVTKSIRQAFFGRAIAVLCRLAPSDPASPAAMSVDSTPVSESHLARLP